MSLEEFIDFVCNLTKPKEIRYFNGSEEEFKELINLMLEDGTLLRLNEEKYPNCYLYRTNPVDTARTEKSTFICTRNKEDAGPTNNWMNPDEAKRILFDILHGCMKDRIMYVVPYILGPINSRYSQVGIQVTDSPYIVTDLSILTRVGKNALERIKSGEDFVKGIHSICNLDKSKRYICHFPEENLIISVNSNYGGNAILSKKGHSLRIASFKARNENWLAEHMFVTGFQLPNEKIYYIAGAFPSASGKTNLAMLKPNGYYYNWNTKLLSDDMAWLFINENGGLSAINPESGIFGILPGTNYKTNPNIMEAIKKNTIFTNVAVTRDGVPWWEGLNNPPKDLIDWRGNLWDGKEKAAHPNARFTVSIYQYPSLSEKIDDPKGVEISAILFGGRRSTTVPLVLESFDWLHGILIGAMLRVETTVAADSEVGILRNDPFAMIPFCGYNMADYFSHWINIGKKLKRKPKIFLVNFFRKDENGNFIWPGFSENIRIIEWIIRRINNEIDAIKTPIGYLPRIEDINIDGLELRKNDLKKLLEIDIDGWLKEFEENRKFFETFGNRFPRELWEKFSEIYENLKYFKKL